MPERRKKWWEPGSNFEKKFIKGLIFTEGLMEIALAIYALSVIAQK